MKKNRFEGWYFKHYHESKMFAVIPGVSRQKDGKSCVFIQIILQDQSYFLNYDDNDIHISYDPFYIKIGNNTFSEKGIFLDIDRQNITLKGVLRYGAFTRLKTDIMGPFAKIPFMECSHGVLSMRHNLRGNITYNGSYMDFNGGIGYIETDKGCSFPETYLWTQCNVFAEENLSIMMAGARIPFAGISFMGCICTVLYRGKEYRIATYNGARILKINQNQLVAAQRNLRLEAELIKSNEKELYAPAKGEMNRSIYEDLDGTVRYRFYKDGKLLFRAASEWASFEYAVTTQGQKKQKTSIFQAE